MSAFDEKKLMRRVAGYHDIRMDGMTDLVTRAMGMRVLDLGCNRGLVGFEFANNGASMVHGLDNDRECIQAARHLFCDLRNCEMRFEVADLSQGARALDVLGAQKYDVTLMLATYHKLKRVTKPDLLAGLMIELGRRTKCYFAYRGTSHEGAENEKEIDAIEFALDRFGFKLIHRSHISEELGVAIIWKRNAHV